MLSALVGFTGFVGSNLMKSYNFDVLYNSKNIQKAYYTEPDLLVYCGVPAEMFLANSNSEVDLKVIQQAIRNIEKIKPKKLVLISTVAVYNDISDGNEDTIIDKSRLSAYGRNRLFLEEWVEKYINDYLIVRLPALYGNNLKKNFIYDYIHVIPKLLKESKYEELFSNDPMIQNYYTKQKNGFYRCNNISKQEQVQILQYFKKVNFSAVNFTDSRNIYQFFNLSNLWNIINIAEQNSIKKLNIVTEPVSIQELYQFLNHREFFNEISEKPLQYNLKTKHAEIFGGKNGYIFTKNYVLNDLENFLRKKHET